MRLCFAGRALLFCQPHFALYVGRQKRKADAESPIAGGQLFGIELLDFQPQGGGGIETIEPGVVVGEAIERNFINRGNLDVTRAGNVATLARFHFAPFPQADGLRFLPTANGVEEFFLEQEHGGKL